MWWHKRNELHKRAKDLLRDMTVDEAVKFCVAKQIEAKVDAARINERYRIEYVENLKKQHDWRDLANYISNSKLNTK